MLKIVVIVILKICIYRDIYTHIFTSNPLNLDTTDSILVYYECNE